MTTPQARYKFYMIIAESNQCHNCGLWRESNHDCPAMRITQILWEKFQAGRNG
ncbi:MAG TPA: hypothetical protein VF477_11330 [Mycobacterium sp.]